MKTHQSNDRNRKEQAVSVSPTLGLLPVLAVSTMTGGTAYAQETLPLDPITLQAGSGSQQAQSEEAQTGYVLTNSTSQKVPTEIADTPKTITVVTQKQMEERGTTSVYDALRTTPGITLRAGEGGTPAGDIPQIRGFDASNDILVDGMRNSSRTSYETFNLESIEVSKGASGATDGAGAEGGTINLNTKTPLEGRFTDVGLSYGTGNFKRVTIDSNYKTGRFGTRLNLMYQDADDLGGKKGKTSDQWGIAPSFSYDLTDASKLTFGLYYHKNEDMPDYGVRMSNASVPDAYRVGSGTPDDPWQPIRVPTDTFYGTPGRDFRDNYSASGYLRFDHQFDNGLSLSAALRQSTDRTRYLVTQPGIDGGTIKRGAKSGNFKNETLSFNSQLSGDGDLFGMNHRFGVGVDISSSDATRFNGYSFAPDPTNVDYVDPDLGHWSGTITPGDVRTASETKSQTIYAFDVIDLTPRMALSLGLSYSHYDVSTTTAATGVTESVESDLVNGSVGLTYDVNENAMVYGAISTSSKPGGLGAGTGGEDASNDLNDLDPERSRSYEIGTKWKLLNDRLLLSAAAFHIDKDNTRVDNEFGDEENVGKTRSQGIELGLAGQINDRWSISAGYVYQDVKLVYGGFRTPRGGGAPYPDPGTGNQLVKIPKNSFTLWTTYAATDKLTLGGGLTYTDERVARYNRDTASPYFGQVEAVIPESWQVDLMASYKIAKATSLQLSVNNVFDEHVYGDAHSTQHVYTEPGRNFVLLLKHEF